MAADTPVSTDDALVSERARAAQIALARLCDRDREVLTLVAWDELSHAEIAIILGCTENAVAIRLHRARKRLQESLQSRGDPPQSTTVAHINPTELQGRTT